MHTPFLLDGREVFITTSIGISLAISGRERPTDLVRNADVALYRAKARGKATHEVFDAAMNVRSLERLDFGSELRRAIEREEFVVYYQPQLELLTGKMVGVEALVHWEHPERNLVFPNEFIPVAEETGLIRPLGWWVLKEACRQVQGWHEQYSSDPPLTLCVNLSTKQLQHPRLVEEVSQILEETKVDPRSLVLEVTESAMMEDAESNASVLRRLVSLGVRLAIDDFGTGYSSLAYLKRFPVDMVKIDKSFVDGLGKDPEDTAIVEAVVSLAHALGLKVVAEGIETTEQLSQLLTLGCELGQGYHFERPLPGNAITEQFMLNTP